jgi:small-conductance mechanosensitive channel
MRIAHSFLAILAGFITIVGLMGIAAALLKRLAPDLTREDASPDPLILAVNVGLTLIFSLLGGYVTARFAQSNPLIHTLMLAFAVLLLSALSAMQMKARHPAYYLLVLIAIPPLAVLCGGLLRLHQLGIHW